MTKHSFLPHPIPAAAALIVALGVGVAASSEAHTNPQPDALPLSCALELHDTGRMVEISARLAAVEPIQGTYALEISKSGRGGSSHIRQGGAFALDAGEDTTLGRTMMNGDPEDFDIDFTLEWNGLTLSCPSLEL